MVDCLFLLSISKIIDYFFLNVSSFDYTAFAVSRKADIP